MHRDVLMLGWCPHVLDHAVIVVTTSDTGRRSALVGRELQALHWLMRRARGEGSVFRVPADPDKPLVYWQVTLDFPRHVDGRRNRVTLRSRDYDTALRKLAVLQLSTGGGDTSTAFATGAAGRSPARSELLTDRLAPVLAGGDR